MCDGFGGHEGVFRIPAKDIGIALNAELGACRGADEGGVRDVVAAQAGMTLRVMGAVEGNVQEVGDARRNVAVNPGLMLRHMGTQAQQDQHVMPGDCRRGRHSFLPSGFRVSTAMGSLAGKVSSMASSSISSSTGLAGLLSASGRGG